MGLFGVLLGLALLVWLSFRGWTVLVLAPAAALIAALAAGEPLLAHWTQTFMSAAGGFVAQFFPLFMLGALFGKLMDDSGSTAAIARLMTERLGAQRAILAVVLAGAMLTYGGLALFAAYFVLAPMAQALFRAADIPHRLMPGAIALGTSTFTLSALPGTPAVRNAIPMPFFGTTPFAAPGLGIIAAVIMLVFGLWWLKRAEAAARRASEGFGTSTVAADAAADDLLVRERATVATEFDPAEMHHGAHSDQLPSAMVALAPLVTVVLVNFLMSQLLLPRLDTSFLADERWGGIALSSVSGVWSVIVALVSAIAVLIVLNVGRLPSVRDTVDAGTNASALPMVSVASLVGYGAVVTAMPAFQVVSDWILSIEGGPLISLAISANLLAALTGSASGGLSIALHALGSTYMQMAADLSIDPALLHRVAVISAGTLDSLPHSGGIVSLLAVCGATHRQSYFDIVMVGIVGVLLGLVAVIVLGTLFGSF
jgi:H+/gluconate symporter-like permease